MNFKFLFLLIFLASFRLSAQIVNIESLRSFVDTAGFHGVENFNFGYNKNTRELFNLTNNLSLRYSEKKHLLLFLNTTDIQLANEVILEANMFFHLRYNYQINNWLTAEAFSQFQKNVPLRIGSRVLVGFGPRFTVIDKDKSSIYIGVLGMYEHDDELDSPVINRDIRLSNYLVVNLKLTEQVKWTNFLYYQPRADKFEDYRTSVQSQLEIKILKNLAFTTTLNLAYDAFPVVDPAIPNLTVKWINGISYKF